MMRRQPDPPDPGRKIAVERQNESNTHSINDDDG